VKVAGPFIFAISCDDPVICDNLSLVSIGGGVAKLVGVSEIAEHYGVGSTAVSNWRARYDDFPEPVVMLRMGPLFTLESVEAWHREHWGDD
jgi:hypothetical protein